MFVIVFEAICFVYMKLLIEQGLTDEFAFDKKAFKTFSEI